MRNYLDMIYSRSSSVRRVRNFERRSLLFPVLRVLLLKHGSSPDYGSRIIVLGAVGTDNILLFLRIMYLEF